MPVYVLRTFGGVLVLGPARTAGESVPIVQTGRRGTIVIAGRRGVMSVKGRRGTITQKEEP
jgi:hypothetical protein